MGSQSASVSLTTRKGAYSLWAASGLDEDAIFDARWERGGWRAFILTKGLVAVTDVVCMVVDRLAPASLDVMTWSIVGPDAEQLRERLTNGRLRSIRLVLDRVTETRARSRRMRASWIADVFGAANIRVTNNHAKCMVVRGAGRVVSILTSGNLNANPRCEFVDLCDDLVIGDSISALVDDIFKSHPEGFDFGSAGRVAYDWLMTGQELEALIHAPEGDGEEHENDDEWDSLRNLMGDK
jgi:hypothetical protein